MGDRFEGWPAEGPALLAAIAADNTRESWAAHREQHAAAVLAPMRALAAALEAEFGPVRVLRPQVNRRFRPGAAPYRTDTGGVARTSGGCTLSVVMSATALSVSAGHWAFDAAQRRRYRAAVDGRPGEELVGILDSLDGFALAGGRTLTGTPRGWSARHPRIGLLRHRGLQATRGWDLGPWSQTAEPLQRVREAWRAAAPFVGWLDAHVGAPEPLPPQARPPTADATAAHSSRPAVVASVVSAAADDRGGRGVTAERASPRH